MPAVIVLMTDRAPSASRFTETTFRRDPSSSESRRPNREILGLAALALCGLMAEPLYILVDTAIVGHLGRVPLAALGVAGAVLANVFANFNFLTYAATAQIGRARGAGMMPAAARIGAQALWLSMLLGIVVALGVFALADSIIALMGANEQTASLARDYLRIACVGLPFAFIAMGAQGYLRGLGDLKTPLLIIGAANAANVVLELVFVFGLAWGIKGSAAATALAQLSMGAAFIYRARSLLLERFDGRAALRLFAVGWRIFVRSLSLHGTILFAAAVATRAGDASIAAHQITFQLWIFLALSLDAFAIAGQVVVAHRLGGGDRDAVLFVAGRVIRLAVLAGLGWAGAVALLYDFLPRLFTTDPAVITRMHAIWPIFVAILPISAAVYALEGILFGVGDVGYLMWATLAAAATGAALCLAVSYFNIGIIGVWSALAMMNMVRFATLSWRYRRGRWAVVAAHGALA